MSSRCQNITTKYEHLQILTAEFKQKYNAVRHSGDLGEVRQLYKNLEAARDALLEQLAFFSVPSAEHPNHQALLDAGLPLDKTQEYEDMKLDLRQEIERQLMVYAAVKDPSGRPLLDAWVNDIQAGEDLIYKAVVKDRAKIIERIKRGMIPVVMPGRKIQEHSWETALLSLQPLWVIDGEEKAMTVNNHLDSDYKNDTTKKMTTEGFFKNIPDRPYLVWTKPTQRPDFNTRNRSFAQQQALYEDMVANDALGLYDATDLIPTEYAALQTVATSQIQEELEERAGEDNWSWFIVPLDYDEPFTRFLSMGPFSNGCVPSARFSLDGQRLIFTLTGSGAFDGFGFRPAARS